MIPRSHLITLDQVIIGICKTTNSLIVRVVCNVGLTVRALAWHCATNNPTRRRYAHLPRSIWFLPPRKCFVWCIHRWRRSIFS